MYETFVLQVSSPPNNKYVQKHLDASLRLSLIVIDMSIQIFSQKKQSTRIQA